MQGGQRRILNLLFNASETLIERVNVIQNSICSSLTRFSTGVAEFSYLRVGQGKLGETVV
jgi:hypothetical protein